jgi:hypothetical protein
VLFPTNPAEGLSFLGVAESGAKIPSTGTMRWCSNVAANLIWMRMQMEKKPQIYERRLQVKHFFDDKQTGQTRRTWLEIQLKPPERTEEGWVNDGKVRLSLGEDKDVKGAFLLSIDEACRLYKALEVIVEDHEILKAKLWRES